MASVSHKAEIVRAHLKVRLGKDPLMSERGYW